MGEREGRKKKREKEGKEAGGLREKGRRKERKGEGRENLYVIGSLRY